MSSLLLDARSVARPVVLGAMFLIALAGAVLAQPPGSRSPAPVTTASWDEFAEVKIPARLRMAEVDAGGSLTRRAALELALRDNPGLKAARERVEVARAEYRQKSAANNPQLSVGASLVPHPADDGTTATSQLLDSDLTSLSYVFPTSGKRLHRTRSADARLRIATAELRSAELELTQNVLQAYADLQAAQESIAVQEDVYRIALAFTDLARRQVQAGAVPETNIIRTQVEEGRAEQELRKAQADRMVREAALAYHIGRPPGSRLAATEALQPRPPDAQLAALQEQALAARPEIAAAAALADGQRAETDLARAARRPDLTVESAFTDHLTNSGAPPMRAVIHLPLWDRGQVDGDVARARSETRVAQHLVEQVRRQVQLDVARAYQQVQGASAALAVLDAQVLPRTHTLIQRARTAYQAGAGTLLDLLDAQRVYRQAALDHVNASADLERSVAALERAVGRPVDLDLRERVGHAPKGRGPCIHDARLRTWLSDELANPLACSKGADHR